MTHYWFKPKRYGYGATPVTWQGWAVTLAGMAVVVVSVVGMNLLVERSNVVAWMLWALLLAAATYWFVHFSRRKTEGEWQWRWGAGDKS